MAGSRVRKRSAADVGGGRAGTDRCGETPVSRVDSMRGHLRAVIVDDMALARERVARYLADEAEIEIVGEAANGTDAVSLIIREGPDIAFLDVGLPDFNGFEILRRLPRE